MLYLECMSFNNTDTQCCIGSVCLVIILTPNAVSGSVCLLIILTPNAVSGSVCLLIILTPNAVSGVYVL